VRLVSGPVALPAPEGVERISVETASEMFEAVKSELPADIFIAVAAVADWRPAIKSNTKLKLKGGQDAGVSLQLVENPDILKRVSGRRKDRPRLVIGFAAETHDVEKHAAEKLSRKGCDWIVGNDVSGDVMGGADNQVVLVTRQGIERWPRLGKGEVAFRLARRIADAFAAPDASIADAAE